MTSIAFLTKAIYCNISRYNYLKTEKLFLNFFLYFVNLDSIFKFLRKEMTLSADVFFNLRTPKNVVR